MKWIMKWIMKRFTSARHLKRFVFMHDGVANLHNCPRYAMSSSGDRALRSEAMVAWREIAEPGIAAQRQGKGPVCAWPPFGKLTVPIASRLAPLRWLRSIRPSLLGGDQSLIVPVQVCVGGRVERVGIEIAGRFHPRSQKA
jgi:hypothetical protein